LCRNETVAVIDDDSYYVDKYCAILEGAGYKTLRASDGIEAIKLLQARNIDLLFIDLDMPRKSGLETFFAALHISPGINAVIHSGFIPEHERHQLMALGIRTFLDKPAGRIETLRAVRDALSERRSYDQDRSGALLFQA
jgi:DNA-binding NtrC family response regulator